MRTPPSSSLRVLSRSRRLHAGQKQSRTRSNKRSSVTSDFVRKLPGTSLIVVCARCDFVTLSYFCVFFFLLFFGIATALTHGSALPVLKLFVTRTAQISVDSCPARPPRVPNSVRTSELHMSNARRGPFRKPRSSAPLRRPRSSAGSLRSLADLTPFGGAHTSW